MSDTNNMKEIREIYGATQEELARAINVNRATISTWENGGSKASSSSLERLSIFYGIGPESFYKVKLDETRRQMLIESANSARQVECDEKRNKAEDLHNIFENMNFDDLLRQYTFSVKLLLASADNGTPEKLKLASQINIKLGNRLKMICKMREDEEKEKTENNEMTLSDLMEELDQTRDCD